MNDLDDILALALEDIDDLPEYTIFPDGAHKVTISLSIKAVEANDKTLQFAEVECVAVETIELEDPSAEPLKKGDISVSSFNLSNREFGLPSFKKFLAFFPELRILTIQDALDKIQDLEVVIISKSKVSKKDPDKVFFNIKKAALV